MKSQNFGIILMFSLSTIAAAQTTQTDQVVPIQLQGAQKVFLGNGGAPALGVNAMKGGEFLYKNMRGALNSVPNYQLVETPEHATLTLVIKLQGGNGATSCSAASDPLVVLDIYDAKSHTLLWSLDDPATDAYETKQFQKRIDESMKRITSELNALAAGKLP